MFDTYIYITMYLKKVLAKKYFAWIHIDSFMIVSQSFGFFFNLHWLDN